MKKIYYNWSLAFFTLGLVEIITGFIVGWYFLPLPTQSNDLVVTNDVIVNFFSHLSVTQVGGLVAPSLVFFALSAYFYFHKYKKARE